MTEQQIQAWEREIERVAKMQEQHKKNTNKEESNEK